jgi:hypothetical protein
MLTTSTSSAARAKASGAARPTRRAASGSVYAFVAGRGHSIESAAVPHEPSTRRSPRLAAVTLFGDRAAALAGLRVDWVVVALLGWLLVGGLAAGGLRPAVRAVIVFEAAAVVVILALMAVVVRALASGTAPRASGSTPGSSRFRRGCSYGTLVSRRSPRSWPSAASSPRARWGEASARARRSPGDAGGDRTGCGVLRDLRDGADVGIRSGRGGRRGVRRVRDPSRRPRAAYAGPGSPRSCTRWHWSAPSGPGLDAAGRGPDAVRARP